MLWWRGAGLNWWPSYRRRKTERFPKVFDRRIHGWGPSLALKLIGECGTDLRAWPTAKHFTSWLCLAPGNKISGGKVLSSRTRRSSSRAAALLRLAATTIGRSDTALGAFYRRLLLSCGQSKGRDGDRSQDCGPVLQHPQTRHDLQRSGCQPL